MDGRSPQPTIHALQRFCFRLNQATIAVIMNDGKEGLIHIPAGAEVLVRGALDGREANNRVDVEWDGKHLSMFTTDLHDRGARV